MEEERSALAQRLTGLPAEKRELLRRMLEEKAGAGKTIPRRDLAVRVPLSFNQQRLWVVEQLLEGVPAYNQTNTIRLQAALDVGAFQRALDEIVRRHESLRTTFHAVDGEPYQQVRGPSPVDLPVVDLRHAAPAEREAEAQRLIAEASAVPFDLETGPLLRAVLYRLAPDDHLFALTLHHIVCDGWSMGVFALELSVLYASYALGRTHALPELPIQYGDFAAWERRWFGGDRLEAQLEYWRAQLAGLRTLELPADRPRPARFSYRGGRVPMVIGGTLFRSLNGLAERENATLHILLLSVLFALAHRYTGDDDIAIGTPVTGRTRKELEPLIGFFVNTQVMRADLSGDPPFLDLLARVRQVCFAAYANQDVPFERLVDELAPVRDPGRSPLVQVLFQIFQPPVSVGVQREHVFPFAPSPSATSKFDLTFELIAHPDEVRGFVEYSTDLFDQGRIERLVAHLLCLMEDVLRDPSRSVSRLQVVPPAERRLLEAWNETAAPYPRGSTLAAELRRQAELHGDRMAVEFGGASLTYAALQARAAALAAELAARGVRPGDCVGLLMSRSLDLPWAMAGILAAGAFYVPLDPSHPADYLEFLVADSGAKLVVTRAEHAAVLPGAERVVIEDVPEVGEAPPAEGIAPTGTAWLLYTSGTTGKPKGVPVTHRGALRLVHGLDTSAGPDDRVLHFAPITFDASVLEIWVALLKGATLVIHPPDLPSLEELGAFVRERGVTWAFLTTGLFRQMVEHSAGDLRRVRELFTGGEALPPAVARAAWKALPRTRLVNAYGPTECATVATTFPVTSGQGIADGVPIGKPLRNTTIRVLDRYGNPVPVGVPGEICIGGDGVAPGYWRRPGLTARSFVPDPAGGGGTLYRTGDVGRFRADGNLEFVGRRDHQVKVRGYRIEPGEVEAALAAHPLVTGAAALLVGEGEEKHLAAFAETLPGRDVTTAELRAHLATLLPEHMLPARLETVERLPLTAHGKVDVAGLARGATSPRGGRDARVAPETALETFLAGIWKELLHLEHVGVTDSFFALGGHSLVATRLLSRIRATLQGSVGMKEFFDQPTIQGLAAALAKDEQMVRRAELLARLGAAAPAPVYASLAE
ncbi:MAG TPA: amino acid adenylation domain-containing protein [Longimicrobium sp.]|nr:amino acid adenylation domain-containing protein [Longimicrobium sp.]